MLNELDKILTYVFQGTPAHNELDRGLLSKLNQFNIRIIHLILYRYILAR